MRYDYPHGIGELTEALHNQPKLTLSKLVAELGLEPGWSDFKNLLFPGRITWWKLEPQLPSVHS